MRIIKLDAIDSTNLYLRRLSLKERLVDYTVVVASSQEKGKGQMGANWVSEPHKNLMVSVFKGHLDLPANHAFYLSRAVALAVVATLNGLGVLNLSIKWPNDILSDNKKICGILIENVFKGHCVSSSIIGIGLNVNQENFDELPQASSLKCVTGRDFDLDEILIALLGDLKAYLAVLASTNYQAELKTAYERLLFKRGEIAEFTTKTGAAFKGVIQAVSTSGKLQVLVAGNKVEEFDLKEITLAY